MAQRKITKRGRIKEKKLGKIHKDTGKKKLSKEEKQTLVVIGFMLAAFAAFLAFFFIYRNIGTFVYEGIRFQKTDMQGLTLYQGKVGINTGGNIYNYKLF